LRRSLPWAATLLAGPALCVVVAGCHWRPAPEPRATATSDLEPREIAILHTNDEHGHLEHTERGGSARAVRLP